VGGAEQQECPVHGMVVAHNGVPRPATVESDQDRAQLPRSPYVLLIAMMMDLNDLVRAFVSLLF
jgi:hypothetical protein